MNNAINRYIDHYTVNLEKPELTRMQNSDAAAMAREGQAQWCACHVAELCYVFALNDMSDILDCVQDVKAYAEALIRGERI